MNWLAQLVARVREPGACHIIVRGIPVVVQNTRPDIAAKDVTERLDEALELIERYQPWRLAHLRRDVLRIFVVRYPCRGAYLGGERTVILVSATESDRAYLLESGEFLLDPHG